VTSRWISQRAQEKVLAPTDAAFIRLPEAPPWNELLKRVFLLDVLVFNRCGGRMKVLCAVHPPEAKRRILDCLGLPSRPPPIAPAMPVSDQLSDQQMWF
jgi:hypothetical protein